MSLSFNEIPINIRTPGHYLEVDSTRAVQGLPAVQHKILVIGQRRSSGTVAEGNVRRIFSGPEAENFFGRDSMLAAMITALKAANSYTECWAVGLNDNAAGVAATGSLTISGAPTEAGTLHVYVAGDLVQVPVALTSTPTSLAAALTTAINAATNRACSATSALGVVTLTARHKGELGNTLDVRLNYQPGQRTPKGLDVTEVVLSGGTANPDIQVALTAIGDEQFHTIISPYVDASNLTKLHDALSTRFGPMVQKDGHAFCAAAGTPSQQTTIGGLVNSPHITIVSAGRSPTPAYIWAAVTGAVDAAEPDPARPRQTLVLKGLLPPLAQSRYTREERNTFLYAGIATTVVDAGGRVLIERLITTYKTNVYGVPDISFLDVETLRTISYLRFSVRSRIALKFPRHKLASDGTRYGAGQAIVTPKVIRAELVALFAQWEEAGLAEGMEQFKRDLIVERNSTDPNRVDAIIPPDTVNQFRVFAAQVQFRL